MKSTGNAPTPTSTRYWVSWYEPFDDDGIVRIPASTPEGLRAAWISGQTCGADPECATVCAVIDATDEDAAWAVVEKRCNPVEQRFIEPRDADWKPPADRFPPYEGATL
jgi:hypothetical protein